MELLISCDISVLSVSSVALKSVISSVISKLQCLTKQGLVDNILQ